MGVWQRVMRALSLRELEVVAAIVEGKSNAEIARALDISVKTVTNHVFHIMDKLNTRSRAGIVGYAFKHGIAK